MKTLNLCIMAAAMLTITACGSKKKQEAVAVRPVAYTEVTTLGSAKKSTFSGTARTDKIINLSFRNSGVLVDFDITLGQKVRKGELLGTLDNVAARLSFESAKAAMSSAESQMNTAKLALNRVRTLYEKGSASLGDYESAKNSYKTAAQSFESAKRSMEIQEEQVRYGYLYAPDNGVISSIKAEIDENISPGQTVAVLNAGQQMEIALGIPESVINEIAMNMEVEVSFTAIENRIFKGYVSEISPAVDEASSTYPVRIKIEETDNIVKSGMAANVTFEFEKAETVAAGTLVVPASAVSEDAHGRFVFLLEASSNHYVVKKQTITIGELTSEGFVVKSGIKKGQKVATAGLQILLEGQEVKLMK